VAVYNLHDRTESLYHLTPPEYALSGALVGLVEGAREELLASPPASSRGSAEIREHVLREGEAAIARLSRERRVLLAAMGRGMTDVILILLALQSGVIPAAQGAFILEILPTTVLISAITCALLLVWADRTPPPILARLAPPPAPEASARQANATDLD